MMKFVYDDSHRPGIEERSDRGREMGCDKGRRRRRQREMIETKTNHRCTGTGSPPGAGNQEGSLWDNLERKLETQYEKLSLSSANVVL